MLKIKFMNKEKFLDRYKGKCTFVSLDDDMVTLSCPVHGQFIRSVYYALRVPDCPVCIREKEQKRKSYTQESFIEKAKELYPEYDYSLVKYVNSKTKITIIKNGEKYIVSPAHFLMNGIPDKKENPNKSNTEEFIKKAKAVWGDKYDYSLVDYKGVFKTSPKNILYGNACPKCSRAISKPHRKLLEAFPDIDWSVNDRKVLKKNP